MSEIIEEKKSEDMDLEDKDSENENDKKAVDEKEDDNLSEDKEPEDGKKDKKKKEKKSKRDKLKKDKSDNEQTDSSEGSEENIDKKKKSKKDKNAKNPEEINIVKDLLWLIVYIGIVILLCFAIIKFVGLRSRVDGSSMEPTLYNDDNLWIDKLSYTFGDPKRFDVIIFNYDDDTTFIKRIIGLPGETVRIDTEGNIYINEQMLSENYGKETILPSNIGRAIQPVELGEDEYFVLGDNRNNSRDSRYADVGNVSRDSIIGKAVLRIYPFSSFGFID